jgi:hypothetical protein
MEERKFPGTCNHHHRFIINYADYVVPLLGLLKKGLILGTRWRSWLRHCAASRKLADVIGNFHSLNPSSSSTDRQIKDVEQHILSTFHNIVRGKRMKSGSTLGLRPKYIQRRRKSRSTLGLRPKCIQRMKCFMHMCDGPSITSIEKLTSHFDGNTIPIERSYNHLQINFSICMEGSYENMNVKIYVGHSSMGPSRDSNDMMLGVL